MQSHTFLALHVNVLQDVAGILGWLGFLLDLGLKGPVVWVRWAPYQAILMQCCQVWLRQWFLDFWTEVLLCWMPCERSTRDWTSSAFTWSWSLWEFPSIQAWQDNPPYKDGPHDDGVPEDFRIENLDRWHCTQRWYEWESKGDKQHQTIPYWKRQTVLEFFGTLNQTYIYI